MYQYKSLLAKELCDNIRMCMYFMYGIAENKYKELKFVENCVGDSMFFKLTDMIDKGEFNQAENLMYECLSFNDVDDCYTMLCVYDYMNEFDDEFLEVNDYTRDEIRDGVDNIREHCGLGKIGYY